ncbi:MAG: zinc-ribbon and DUF3426 domain-containing protein [Gallionella sp.]
MAGTTTCPHCGTRFKISREQLEIHHGMVRCGNCLQAFDTRPHFTPEEIDPQLVLPILDESYVQEPAIATVSAQTSVYDNVEVESERVEHDVVEPGNLDVDMLPTAASPGQPEPPDPLVTEQVDPSPGALADDEAAFLAEPKSRLWGIASVLLVLTLIFQSAYLFRVELAARVPALKPGLESACELLDCTVPLPQNAELMSIESSELKDEPGQGHQILLYALLRNRAGYVQAFPNLELTLTDLQDVALARRVFKPEEYLATPGVASGGLAPNRELSVKLRLDTADLSPVGYRLVLLY